MSDKLNNKEFLIKIEELENKNKSLEAENARLHELLDMVKAERDRARYEIGETRKSISFRVGRIVTFIPRKLRGMD